jgi:uncharacterized protein (DUF302 family)
VSIPPYVILGVCNPPLAHRALEADPSIGTLLPCNVVLREHAGGTVVEALDPRAVLGLAGVPAIEALAIEVEVRLRLVIAALELELGRARRIDDLDAAEESVR